MNQKKYDREPLDKEEKDLLIAEAKEASKNYLDKNKNINIRITERNIQKPTRQRQA
jgi:predicted DNA binding CopG/RHH family protein